MDIIEINQLLKMVSNSVNRLKGYLNDKRFNPIDRIMIVTLINRNTIIFKKLLKMKKEVLL